MEEEQAAVAGAKSGRIVVKLLGVEYVLVEGKSDQEDAAKATADADLLMNDGLASSNAQKRSYDDTDLARDMTAKDTDNEQDAKKTKISLDDESASAIDQSKITSNDESATPIGQIKVALNDESVPAIYQSISSDNPNIALSIGILGPLESKKRVKKQPTKDTPKYPTIDFASTSARLQSFVKVGDLQNLILYIFGSGKGPQWCSVKNPTSFKRVVVLMVPGLDWYMFPGKKNHLDQLKWTDVKGDPCKGPDLYMPEQLEKDKLVGELQPLADIFDLVWPVKCPANDRDHRMYSPLQSMLSCTISNPKQNSQPKYEPTEITEFILNPKDLLMEKIVLHSAMFTGEQKKEHVELLAKRGISESTGWRETEVDANGPHATYPEGSLWAGWQVLAIDCEMISTAPYGQPSDNTLARISVTDWKHEIVLDEYVKPPRPVTNYLTQYSGITAELLETATMTLEDVQQRLIEIISEPTILVGHSITSDLKALKLIHPHIVDTAVMYPHPRGGDLKYSLKKLAEMHLNKNIQLGDGATGHDSVEDAVTAMQLVRIKCERGKIWPKIEATSESIFTRLGSLERHKKHKQIPDGPPEFRTGAVVDWGHQDNAHGTHAAVNIACATDEYVVSGIDRAINGLHPTTTKSTIPAKGVDFVFARFRELEAFRNWTVDWKTSEASDHMATSRRRNTAKDLKLEDILKHTVSNIAQVYENLPPCTAFIVFTGSGDINELTQLQKQKADIERAAEMGGLPFRYDQMVHFKEVFGNSRIGVGFIGTK